MSTMTNRTTEQMWDKLLSMGVEEQTLQIVTNINGYRTDVLEDILYAHTGYRSFDQMEEVDADTDE